MTRDRTWIVIALLLALALSAVSCRGNIRLRGQSELDLPDEPAESWALGCMLGPEAIATEPDPDAAPAAAPDERPTPDTTQAAIIEVLVSMHGAERSAWPIISDRVIERLEGDAEDAAEAWHAALGARLEGIKDEVGPDFAATVKTNNCAGALSELHGSVAFVQGRRNRR